MRQIDLNEYKQLLVLLLKEIDVFCKREKLTYYLDSGTLLGAVRHHGFIPWDDDIDLAMPRDDYEKFISSFKSDLGEIITFNSNGRYFYPYAKVNYKKSKVIEVELPQIDGLGVNIDIFPLDGMPNKLLLRRIHQDLLMFLNKTRALSVRIRRKAPGFLKPLFRWRILVKWIDRLGKKHTIEGSHYCGNIVATTVRHKEIPVQCFASIQYVDFEDGKYPAPSGYDEYLRRLYGDYMKLPPKEKQITRHNVEAYIYEEN